MCISVIADIMLHLFKFNLFVLWYVNLRLSNFDKDILPKVSITYIISQERINLYYVLPVAHFVVRYTKFTIFISTAKELSENVTLKFFSN